MFETDHNLAGRCLRGDPEAFGKLYDRHVTRVFHLLRRLTSNPTEAEDLTQETFLAAYAALSGWRKEGAFGTWLCGIAYKRYANARRTPRLETELWDAQETAAAPESDPLLHYTRREREQLIEQAILHLPDICREVFVLVKVEGFAYREAAALLEVPVGTVQSRLWRATQLLQKALSAEYAPNTSTISAHIPNTLPPVEPKGETPDALHNRA